MISASAKIDWTNKLSNRLIRWRWTLAFIGIVSGILAFPIASRLDFDRRVESLFPADDPDLLAYHQLQDIFGGKSVILLVYHDPELWTREGIDRNRQITQSVKKLVGVADVLSVSRLSDAMDRLRPSFGETEIPNLFRKDDAIASGFAELFTSYTHSRDRERAAMVVLLNQNATAETLDLLKAIRDKLQTGRFGFQVTTEDSLTESDQTAATPPLDAVLVGESIMISDALDLIKRDGKTLAGWTVLLLSAVLLMTLGDLRLVILAGLSIVWSVKMTQAMLVVFGWQLSIASAVLTALVTVITVTSVLHLGVPYRRLVRRGVTRSSSAKKVMSSVATPILWTGLTDAAGFLALVGSSLAPIAQFGCMVAIAVMMTLFALCIFSGVCLAQAIPGVGGIWPSVAGLFMVKSTRRTLLQRVVRRGAMRLVVGAMHRPVVVIGLLLLIVGLAVLGVPRLESERSFLNNFRADSQISESYQTVERHFGGAGAWDVMLRAPLHLTDGYLQSVRELEERLRLLEVDNARLTKVLSIADAEWVVRKSRFAAFLPVEPRLSFMSIALPGFFKALLSQPVDGHRYLRVMLRSRENLEPSQKDQLIREVRRLVMEYEEAGGGKDHEDLGQAGKVAGYYLLLNRLIDQVLRDQWRCLAGSIAMVGLLMWFFFRSFTLAMISLLPNVLPMVVVLALCGLSGERLNMGAAMIAAVSIGISIDGSVHLLFQYQRYRMVGRKVVPAIQIAAGRIGFPIILATLALVIGFGVLSQSEFVPTATFGFLIAVTLILGTVANLTILPTFLRLVEKD